MEMLIIKLGAIGDVIRTTSIIQGLKSKYKNAKIDWVTKKESFDVLKNNKSIEKIYLVNSDFDKLKNINYDFVISLDDDEDACRLASAIKYKKIIGAFIDNGKRVYTQDSSAWFDMGLISRFGKQKADDLKAKNKKTYQELIYLILDLRYEKQEPILILSNDENEFGKNFASKNNIGKNDLVIGINTGAGGRWEDKRLSILETAELIDNINNQIKNVKVILFGGPEEKVRNGNIKKSVKSKIIDAGCDNSLMEFASLVNLCNVLVTSDSLALHIGTALKKKIVCFFYPTSASEIELYNRGVKIIGKGNDYCSYKPKCDYPPKWNVDEIGDGVKKLA
ncbi:MAG TPA: glycosyltransferase family 9 protein [Candidatus Nanoarchaeia archaeon]|nr:glycosyltransferase family 9 protein [Candidatus Nanoarchaeia archaeon]